MTFKSGNSEVLLLLGEHAGIGLWDCAIVEGDPFGPGSAWSWSPEFRRMLGFASEAEFPDDVHALLDCIHRDDLDRVVSTFAAALADPMPVSRYDIKYRVQLADESHRWFRSIGSVTHDTAGTATRACGSLIDIHESEMAAAEAKRRMDQQLANLADAKDASQERLRQITNASAEGIAITDEAGIVLFWNAASEEQFGIPAHEIVGRHLNMILLPENRYRDDFLKRHLAMIGKIIESEGLHRDGSRVVLDISVSTWTEGGQRCFGFIARDTAERKAREAHLAALALRDPLTKLPNRAALGLEIERLLKEEQTFIVMMVDLDGFKRVNDTLGHEAGDAVLTTAATRMAACICDDGMLARFGGDEFGIVLTGGCLGHASAVANAVIQAISCPIETFVPPLAIGASVGIARAPIDGNSAQHLLASADAALYAAKTGGRGRFQIVTPGLLKAAADLDADRRQLHGAIDRGEFELFYQPQYRLRDRRMVGAEALLRWHHPQEGLLTPDRFLAAIDRSPLSGRVGAFVLDEACRQAAEWRRVAPDFRVAINLFAEQLRNPGLPAQVGEILSAHGIPGTALELELPETLRLDIDADIRGTLAKLRTMGVGIALDDYGTGYASFATLRHVPATRLKIDRSFVQGMAGCEVDAATVETTLLIGSRLKVSVIAEGIETPEQEAQLVAAGCALGQGYLFGRPMPASDFAARFIGGHAQSRSFLEPVALQAAQ